MTNGPVKSIKAGKHNFNVTRANAVQQKTLMTLVGGRITMNAASASASVDHKFLIGVLITLPEQTLDEVTDLVLYKTIESGGKELVSLETWQHGMIEFFELLAKAIYFNLSDFFMWLDKENAVTKAKPAEK